MSPCLEPNGICQPKTLDLGWVWNENKRTFTIAKIKQEDRATHTYIIGASGSGKSKFIEYLLMQDIEQENGFCLIDPHGDLTENIKSWLAVKIASILAEEKDRLLEEGSEKFKGTIKEYQKIVEDKVLKFFKKIVIIDPTNPTETVIFNPLEIDTKENTSPAEQAAELILAFKRIWQDSWGARMEEILRNSLIVLIENNLTLLELASLLTDPALREKFLQNTKHPIAKQYFETRYNKLNPKTRNEWIESTLNKVNSFLADDRIRQMLSIPQSTFNLRDVIDNKKILLINLNKGRLKDNANLLGALMIAKLQMAVLSRSNISEAERTRFFLYVDEFQNFATNSFTEILAEARKYGLSLILAHQNQQQLFPELQASILANTGIQVYFRLNRQDAEILAKECFETTGTAVKHSKISPQSYDPAFYSYQEEWERYYQELQTLEPRFCYVKHKREGGIIYLRTEDIPQPWLEAGFKNERKWKEFIEENCVLGLPYFLEREQIKEIYQKRVKKLKELTMIKKYETKKPQDFRD